MIRHFFMLCLGILGFGIILGIGPGARTEPPSGEGKSKESGSQQEGVEFLARGPIHEAFAAPALRGPRSSPIIAKEPPKPIEELPPDQRPEGDNVQWIPGYWAWDDDPSDFLWVSGTYRTVPPGRHWLPGYWNQAGDGWQWIAGFWADPEKNDLELLPAPPEPIEEAIPPSPADASIFQPGCWVYRDSRYMWRTGFWTPYRAGWTWTPPCYVWTPGGYIAVDGYWDYPLRDRGLLFAPVHVERGFWDRPGWFYRPSYVVHDDFLLTALFVRPSYNQYYFGNYFDPGYDRLGFVAWTSFRHGRTIVDPLFTYYQWQFRDNPGWSRDLRQLYVARREDPAARPPQTLVQQNTVIQNITNNTTTVTNVTHIKNVTALAPLTKVDNTFVKLRPVTKVQQLEVQKAASQFRDFSIQRGKLEAQAQKSVQPSTKPGELPRAIKVELPRTRPLPVRAPDGAKVAAPPVRPVTPKPDPRAVIKPGTGKLQAEQPKSRPPEPKPVAKPAAGKPAEKKAEAPPRPEAVARPPVAQPNPPQRERAPSPDPKSSPKKNKA